MNQCIVCHLEIPEPYAFCNDICEALYAQFSDIIDTTNLEAQGFMRPDLEPVPTHSAEAVDNAIIYDKKYAIALADARRLRNNRHNGIRYMYWKQFEADVVIKPKPQSNVFRNAFAFLVLLVIVLTGLTAVVIVLEVYGALMNFLGYAP